MGEVIHITDTCERCHRDVGEAHLVACGDEEMVCIECWTFEVDEN